MKLLIILLCLINVAIYVGIVIVIPHKMANSLLSIVVMSLGIVITFAIYIPIALLGKYFGIFEPTKSFILIAIGIEAFIETVYRFYMRKNKS